MRRWGAILMILGANIIAGSITVAFWRAVLDCSMQAQYGTCTEGAVRLFIGTMTSGQGLVYWIVIAVGIGVFWRGRRIRRFEL